MKFMNFRPYEFSAPATRSGGRKIRKLKSIHLKKLAATLGQFARP
jgi:hypothetical protein